MNKSNPFIGLSPINKAVAKILLAELREAGGKLPLSIENRTRLGRLGIMTRNINASARFLEGQGIARIEPTDIGVAIVINAGVDLDEFIPPAIGRGRTGP